MGVMTVIVAAKCTRNRHEHPIEPIMRPVALTRSHAVCLPRTAIPLAGFSFPEASTSPRGHLRGEEVAVLPDSRAPNAGIVVRCAVLVTRLCIGELVR